MIWILLALLAWGVLANVLFPRLERLSLLLEGQQFRENEFLCGHVAAAARVGAGR